MERNLFGDPKPQDFDEIVEAIEERHPDSNPADDLYAVITVDEEAHTFYAEILRNEDGEGFTTGDYTNEEDLRKDLTAAGVPVPGAVQHA